jgi:pyruvate/oxaloacetate carboxyltransferase
MPRLELVEASLRYGQQALLLSRLRQRHAVRAAELLDACGFAALEVFGGATFEAQIRFLGEDPFERLRALRRAAPTTPLMATLAGQMLVGHRHLPDDVVASFVGLAAQAGIDIFRILDPLNDPRNVEVAVGAARDAGARVEGVVVCTWAPAPALAGMGAALRRAGCDSICLHDPLGTVGAARATELVESMVAATGLPVAVSFSAQTGQAALAYAAAHRAGAVRADVCVAPLSGGPSLPAAESLIAGLAGTTSSTGLDLEEVVRVSHLIDEVSPGYADLLDPALLHFDGAALMGRLPVSAMGHGYAAPWTGWPTSRPRSPESARSWATRRPSRPSRRSWPPSPSTTWSRAIATPP